VNLLNWESGPGRISSEGALEIRRAGTETGERPGVLHTDLEVRPGGIEQPESVSFAGGKCGLRRLEALASLRKEVPIDDAIRLPSSLEPRLRVAQVEECRIPRRLERPHVSGKGVFRLAHPVAAPSAQPGQVD